MKYTVRIRVMRDGSTVQLTPYEEKTLAKVEVKYRLLEKRLFDVFQFRIETIDESVIWIGRGARAAQE